MPTFAQEEFLPRALASVFDQTLEEWQLIVVDDGSPGDVGGAIGVALSDERVTLLTLKRNLGLGAALNVALEQADGTLIAYLPSDAVL